MDELVFTPSAVLGLLAQIPELEDLDLQIDEQPDSVILTIGDNRYELESSPDSEVTVDDDAIEEISDINDEGYEDIETDTSESIEGGVIKELAKTLMLGGLIRLTGKAVKDMV